VLALIACSICFYLWRRSKRAATGVPKAAVLGPIGPPTTNPGSPKTDGRRRTSTDSDGGASVEDMLQLMSPHDADWEMITQIMHVTDPQNLGIGRDVRERTKYKTLKPMRAWRINDDEEMIVFEAKKRTVQRQLRELQDEGLSISKVATKLDAVSRMCEVSEDVNEKVLLHGTKPGHVFKIVNSGLNERFSGGLFGHGVYLAEDPSKIDQYCTSGTAEERAQLERLGVQPTRPVPVPWTGHGYGSLCVYPKATLHEQGADPSDR